MKKIILGFALLGAVLTSCKKEDKKTEDPKNGGIVIAQEQKSTVFYFGGTWCPPCGAYGKPAKESIKASAVGSKSTIISCQVGSDPMKCPDGDALNSLFAPSGVPAMYIGAADVAFHSMIGGSSSTATNAINKITEQTAMAAITNCNVSITEADGLINAKVDGKFFATAEGGYYAAAYLLEDKLTHTQSSDASIEKNVHYNIMRVKGSTTTGIVPITGELITDAATKDLTYTKTFSFFAQPAWVKANLSVAVVIWKKNAANKWVVSNSTIKKVM